MQRDYMLLPNFPVRAVHKMNRSMSNNNLSMMYISKEQWSEEKDHILHLGAALKVESL